MTGQQPNPPAPFPDREGGGKPPPPVGERAGGLGSRKLARVAALVVILAAGGFAVWYWGFRGPRDDLERFQGDWQVSVAGRKTPVVIHVAGDQWQSVSNAVDGKVYRITLNAAPDPREIDLDPVDTAGIKGPVPKLHGIYAFDGNNTVRIRVNDTTEPRPQTLDDPDAVVWELTKVKLKAAPR